MWWMVAEQTVFVTHTGVLAFFIYGLYRWKNADSGRWFYVHRATIAAMFMVQAAYGQCPITAFEKYCRTQYDASYEWDGRGCIQEAIGKTGLEVPDWPIRLLTLGIGAKGMVQLVLASRKRQKKNDEELWAA